MLDQEPSSAPTPDTPEPPSLAGTEETASPAQPRRIILHRQGRPVNPAPANPEPPLLPQPTVAPAGYTPRRPKVKEPDVFIDARSKLLEWLAPI